MFSKTRCFCITSLLAAFMPFAAASPSQYVIQISIDGLGSSYLSTLISNGQVPSIAHLKSYGVSTLNARTDYDMTVTLPNHVTMVTGRPVMGSSGHNWTSNDNPRGGQTIHNNKSSYIAGVFDVAHDNGLRTAMYASKTKFSLFDISYDTTNGAPDTTGTDNGRDKIDTYLYDNSSSITDSFLNAMNLTPFNYSFIHYADGDTAGHNYGWGSTQYNNAIINVDGYIDQILTLVDNSPVLNSLTTIILTADHGGNGYGHSTADDTLNYTIPFIVWGAGIAQNQDLYSLNTNSRLDPGAGRPSYSEVPQPIRHADGANLALELLGLGIIPGSTINNTNDLAVPEPTTILLIALGSLTLRRKRI